MRGKEAISDPRGSLSSHRPSQTPWETISDSVPNSQPRWDLGTTEPDSMGRSRAQAQAGWLGPCLPEQPAPACASTGPGTDTPTTRTGGTQIVWKEARLKQATSVHPWEVFVEADVPGKCQNSSV